MEAFDRLVNDIERIEQKLTRFSDDLESGKITDKIFRESSKMIKDDYDSIYRSCVDIYYDSYDPDYYNRQGSLYSMYDVIVTDEDIEYNEDFEYASNWQHRVNNKYIFDKMWMEGWHGGATPTEKRDMFGRPYPEGYEMAYRKPVKPIQRKKKNGKPGKPLPKYSLWSYRQVAKSEPIQKMVDNEINSYKTGSTNSSGSTQKERVDDSVYNVISEYNIYN